MLLLIAASLEPTAENKTLAVSVILSGLYTLFLGLSRRWWLPHLSRRPQGSAIVLGILNAVVIETLFLVAQAGFGAKGIAAHPNLAVDLLITMPWYIGVIMIFVRVQHRRRFSSEVVLLLGALYEVAADGVIGGAFGGVIFTPMGWFFLVTIAYWWFILVYSSIVLPPAWVIAQHPAPSKAEGAAWRDAIKPLYWFVPYTLYLVLFFIIAAVLSELV
ncbi:MAG: hypothetical protein Kow00106_21910 [Anaerolineae bacterium]